MIAEYRPAKRDHRNCFQWHQCGVTLHIPLPSGTGAQSEWHVIVSIHSSLHDIKKTLSLHLSTSAIPRFIPFCVTSAIFMRDTAHLILKGNMFQIELTCIGAKLRETIETQKHLK